MNTPKPRGKYKKVPKPPKVVKVRLMCGKVVEVPLAVLEGERRGQRTSVRKATFLPGVNPRYDAEVAAKRQARQDAQESKKAP